MSQLMAHNKNYVSHALLQVYSEVLINILSHMSLINYRNMHKICNQTLQTLHMQVYTINIRHTFLGKSISLKVELGCADMDCKCWNRMPEVLNLWWHKHWQAHNSQEWTQLKWDVLKVLSPIPMLSLLAVPLIIFEMFLGMFINH